MSRHKDFIEINKSRSNLLEDSDSESATTPFGSFQNQMGLSPNTRDLYLWDEQKKNSSNTSIFSIQDLNSSGKLLNTSRKVPKDSPKTTYLSSLSAQEQEEMIDDVSEVVGSGFSNQEISKALEQCQWDPDKAIDYLYQMVDNEPFELEMDPSEEHASTPKKTSKPAKVLTLNISDDNVGQTPNRNSHNTEEVEMSRSQELRNSQKKAPVVAQHSQSKKQEMEKIVQQHKPEKTSINLVVIGHVDAGKSTLVGHLLVQLGVVDQRTMHRYEKEASSIGKSSFRFAWVTDEQNDERSRGVTVNVGVKNFATNKKNVTMMDAPGHRDYVPNMIGGTSQADVALLVIDSRKGEFENGFEANGQTKEHAMLAKSLGVKEMIVLANKMDQVDYSQERFNHIQEAMERFLKKTGFSGKTLRFLPCSGLTGENLTKKSTNLEWYTGPTLIEMIDNLEDPVREYEKPFRMSISDVTKVPNFGNALSGKVETGFVCTGDKLLLMPLNEIVNVTKIRVNGVSVEYSIAGQACDLAITGVTEFSQVHTGMVVCDPQQPVASVSSFISQAVTFEFKRPLILGENVELHIGTLTEAAVIKRFISILDRKTMQVLQKKPRALPGNTTCEIEISTAHPICLDLYSQCKQLGRFTLRIEGSTVAAGFVSKWN